MDFKRLIGAFSMNILILAAVGGIMLFQSAGDFVVSFKPAISFEDMLDGKEVKAGAHVDGDVVYVLDYFASESTYTERSDGSRSGNKASGRYYLLPTAEGYIGLKSREMDVAVMNKISDETYEFLMGGEEPTTTIHMQGSVEVMEGQLAKYYREYLLDMEYTESEIDAMGDPLVIQYRSFTAVRVLFAIGAALVALAIFLICRRYKRG